MPRDITKPYTEEELDGVKTIFRGMATYSEEPYCLVRDLPQLFKSINFSPSEEQLKIYEYYWNTNYGGVVPLKHFISGIRDMHDLTQSTITSAAVYDKDGDGFISPDEFEDILVVARVHNPRLKSLTFQDFLNEADTNKDGKVSLEECGRWLAQHAK